MPNYNRGQKYELFINEILYRKGLLPKNLMGNDSGFLHRGKPYYLEIKNKDAPDFGQRGLSWDPNQGWFWRKKDLITEMFDEIEVLKHINCDFIPKRHTIPTERISVEDKKYDQNMVKKSGIPLKDVNFLYKLYAKKGCFYIQIEGKGFYYLENDIAKLEVPQFKPELTFRLRAKTHHSKPIYAYSFFVVINASTRSLCESNYDVEELIGDFPPILNW